MSINNYKTDYSSQRGYNNFPSSQSCYCSAHSSAMSFHTSYERDLCAINSRNSSRGSTPKYNNSFHDTHSSGGSTPKYNNSFHDTHSSGRSTPKYKNSFHDRHCSEGKGDPHFPAIEMQVGMIHTMNAQESLKSSNLIIKKIRMLEDENSVTKKRNQCLFIEKEIEAEKRVNLEKRVAELEKHLQEERAKAPAEKENLTMKSAATSATKVPCSSEGVQVWEVCRACRRELQSQENNEPVVTITKLELENLEKDMMTLRDSILSTEETLSRSKKREQNYREQIARLFVEADSAQTLCKTRLDEIKTLAQALSDKDAMARNKEKTMIDMGKLIVKLNKQQRNHKEICQLENGFASEISEKEQKWIEDIERRLCNTKSKQRAKDKATSSQQTSPRGVKITERVIES